MLSAGFRAALFWDRTNEAPALGEVRCRLLSGEIPGTGGGCITQNTGET